MTSGIEEVTTVMEKGSLEPRQQLGIYSIPRLHSLPAVLPLEGIVRLELEEGIPLFRASEFVQTRIQELLLKQRETQLSIQEQKELDQWEEVDDYLSFVNRVVRNLTQASREEEK